VAERTVALPDAEAQPGVLEVGNVWINFLNNQVAVDGQPVVLTFQEFELLSSLVQQPDRVVPVDAITESIWAESGRPVVRRLNVLIHRLRAKMARSRPYQIESVRGRGYGFLAVGGRRRAG